MQNHEGNNAEVWFSSRSPQFREFSNFYLSPFVLDGEEWSCVEQYYQCAKFKHGTEPYIRIREQERPGAMKGLAEHYALQVRADWSEIKFSVMKRAVHAKFAQNPQLLELYAHVSHLTLIHESQSDTFWCVDRHGKGENQLGILVKTVCGELLREKEP